MCWQRCFSGVTIRTVTEHEQSLVTHQSIHQSTLPTKGLRLVKNEITATAMMSCHDDNKRWAERRGESCNRYFHCTPIEHAVKGDILWFLWLSSPSQSVVSGYYVKHRQSSKVEVKAWRNMLCQTKALQAPHCSEQLVWNSLFTFETCWSHYVKTIYNTL